MKSSKKIYENITYNFRFSLVKSLLSSEHTEIISHLISLAFRYLKKNSKFILLCITQNYNDIKTIVTLVYNINIFYHIFKINNFLFKLNKKSLFFNFIILRNVTLDVK